MPGGNAEASIEHVIAAPQFTIDWRRRIGSGSTRTRQVMAPVVAEAGKVFVMDGESTVTAVDAASGEVVWKVDVKPTGREAAGGVSAFGLPIPFVSEGGGSLSGGFGGGVAVSGGKVFVASGYRTMTALDAATGTVVWTQPVDVPIHGAPTVAGSRVYVIDVDNQIIAFNTTTGLQDWSYRGITEPARIMRASSPSVIGDTVIAPFSSGEVVALRAATGQPVQYPHDPFVVAVCTDDASRLPEPTGLPILDLNRPESVADFLLGNPGRYDYHTDHADLTEPRADVDAGRSAAAAVGRGAPAAGD